MELLLALKSIETELGRVVTDVRYQPRPIDLDILFYDDICVKQESPQPLTIPHEFLHERDFVLGPLKEYAAAHCST